MLTEKKNGNVCNVRGTLSENNLEIAIFGNNQKCVRGDIIIKVNQDGEDMFIPIRVFASELKKDGTPSAVYKTWKEVYETYKSIASAGDDADRVECRGARISMNEYWGRNDKLVAFPTITSNFITRNPKAKEDEATWNAIMVIAKCGYKTDEDGVEDKSEYDITAILPKFNGSVDVVPMKATKPTVIDVISNSWQANDTVKAMGKLHFSQQEVTRKVESDFGEPQETTYTVNISDVLITGGNQVPLEGEFAYDLEDIKLGLATHKQYLNDLKQKQADKQAQTASTVNASAGSAMDLGF